jgi:U4/U6.U5 tri-snRNP-associated protein 2
MQVYVLPDGYVVSDPSLEDIAFVLDPSFTRGSLAGLSTPTLLSKPSFDLSGKSYLPGYIGLNNIKRNDYMNVIVHCLLHVTPLRDYLLLTTFSGKDSELLRRFSSLAKKMWNPRLFKSQVSPHEFLQEVGRASAGKFRLETQGDPVEFLSWLLNRLHKDMGGTKRRKSSIFPFEDCAFTSSRLLSRYHLLHLSRRCTNGNTAGCRTIDHVRQRETPVRH